MAVVFKRRDRHEIFTEILSHARTGNLKTRIQLMARLSYSQINDYLPLLIEKGFLECMIVKRRRQTVSVYRVTEKGTRFLNRLESVNKLWDM